MRRFLKSNSVLIAVDSGENQPGLMGGLHFIGLQDSFGFSVDAARISEKQIGSQDLFSDAPSVSPDISFDLSFLPTRKFDTEQSLGLNFNFNPTFESVFLGKAEKFFNLYLFTSNLEGFDFIKQIKDAQSLNGVECISFGNCYLNRYNFSMNVGDLARVSASAVASIMEASIISDDKVKVPQINLSTGKQIENCFLSLSWPQLEKSLEEIEKSNQPILPTTEIAFSLKNDNIGVPSAVISPLLEAKIQSLSFSLEIPRETSYGFDSDYPYGRKIKFPVNGSLEISTIFSSVSSGNYSGIMNPSFSQNIELGFLDSQELFLSGKSFSELSGFFNTGISGVTGFFTDSRKLLISGAKINNWSQSYPINGFSTFDASFSFRCSESGGLMQKFGTTDGSQPYWLYSPDARKIFDSSGDLLTTNAFLHSYGSDGSLNYLIDGNGNLILADNWAENDNSFLYTV